MNEEANRPMAAVLDRAFGHPRGLLGRAGAWLMEHVNRQTELRMTELAALTAEDTVLVLGPGPGVGLAAAAQAGGRVIGVDPSADMLALCRHRCGDGVDLREGTAEDTGLEGASVDVVLSVDNVHLWADRAAGFAELRRVLRPGGRLLLSAHDRWLPVSRQELAGEASEAGFTDLQTWTWQPPGLAPLAAQLRCHA